MVTFEGNTVDLVCNATNDADANIPVQISWYNGTELIKPDGKLVMVNSERNNVTDQVHSVLSLNAVNHTNDGEYVCRAFNHPASFTESRITLTVECEFNRVRLVMHTMYTCRQVIGLINLAKFPKLLNYIPCQFPSIQYTPLRSFR